MVSYDKETKLGYVESIPKNAKKMKIVDKKEIELGHLKIENDKEKQSQLEVYSKEWKRKENWTAIEKKNKTKRGLWKIWTHGTYTLLISFLVVSLACLEKQSSLIPQPCYKLKRP